MNTPKGFIFDLDGTVYRGEQLIPGARAALEQLRRLAHPIVFVTNKPLAHRADYAAKLTRLGVPADPEDVIHSSLVLARTLCREFPDAAVFVIGEQPLLDELTSARIRLSEDPTEIDVVVASFDRTLTYRKLEIGFRALRRGARFWATNADAACPVSNGEIPDTGAVIGALEGCSRRKVERVVGKPSSRMVGVALERLRRSAKECVMVGDRIETDILMGQRAGMTTALVLSGVARREDLTDAPVQPDYVLESIAEVPGLAASL